VDFGVVEGGESNDLGLGTGTGLGLTAGEELRFGSMGKFGGNPPTGGDFGLSIERVR